MDLFQAPDRNVAKLFLDVPDVRPVFEHARRACVAEEMAGTGLAEPGAGDVARQPDTFRSTRAHARRWARRVPRGILAKPAAFRPGYCTGQAVTGGILLHRTETKWRRMQGSRQPRGSAPGWRETCRLISGDVVSAYDHLTHSALQRRA